MIFRIAKESEGAKILELYRSAVGGEFCAWDEEYPGPEEVRGDLAAGNLYLLEDEEGEIAGAVSIVPENELDRFEGWKDRNAAEFARVVIAPALQGKGLAKELVSGVIREIRSRGFTSVHISVAEKNIPARKTYLRAGFVDRGEEDMYGSHFILCEKEILRMVNA